jgi:peptidoglycan/xylan/chitin deacetylase (PgdA/CDA1 family)
MRTQVSITIDTEFSIGGAFADPVRRRPIGVENVTCPVGGREQGLGFLLDCFARHGTQATFFVETLQTAWFGDAAMGGLVRRILEAGQDVQLHLHPCWTAFRESDWQSRLADGDPDDDCDGRNPNDLTELIREGAAALVRMGAPPPVALRTGNLRADRNVYRAMRACGLSLASNIGVGLNRPTDPALRLRGGRHRIEDVLEIPVLTYRQVGLGGQPGERLFTTTATSSAETEHLLWAARAAGVQTIVLLTHPFEFIKGDRLDPARQRANRINQRRLERLCAFLAEHDDAFESVSFAGAGPAWLAAPDRAEPDLHAPLLPVLGRIVENKANDLIAAL